MDEVVKTRIGVEVKDLKERSETISNIVGAGEYGERSTSYP